MKRIFFVTFLIIMASIKPVFADDMGLSDDAKGVENAWYGQKSITDEDFEKTIKKIEEKKNKNKQKKIKGKSLEVQDENKQSDLGEAINEKSILIVPLTLLSESGEDIPVGHYSVLGKQVRGKFYIELWQEHSKIATIEATETVNDFGEKTINFAKLEAYNESYVKLIFGSVDFNAYAFIPIKNGILGQ